MKELKPLFEKERCLLPQSHPECEFEGEILLGCCESLLLYMPICLEPEKNVLNKYSALDY